MSIKIKCKDCLFFTPLEPIESIEGNNYYGRCHRYPPSEHMDVFHEYWCGEHQVERKRRTFDYATSVQIVD